MEISSKYKNSIETMFGDIGKEWIKTVPDKIEKYIKKFNLKNVKLLDNLTYNVLLFAESDEFGPVVLKIEVPFKELTIRESIALKLNDGKGACKCFYSNIDDGVLLIERILPGRTLNSIDNLEDRIKIFSEVSSKFNIEVEQNIDLPSYREILDRSIDLSKEQKEKFYVVEELLTLASCLYDDLHSKSKSNYLLHSDLFCDNILENENGWKAIDPHGFVGEKILDTAIFMQKELEKKDINKEEINKILNLMSANIELDINDLMKALFINYVLNICWNIEVNLDNNYILKSINKANVLLRNLKDMGLVNNQDIKILKYTNNNNES